MCDEDVSGLRKEKWKPPRCTKMEMESEYGGASELDRVKEAEGAGWQGRAS